MSYRPLYLSGSESWLSLPSCVQDHLTHTLVPVSLFPLLALASSGLEDTGHPLFLLLTFPTPHLPTHKLVAPVLHVTHVHFYLVHF